jgi:hypothetical protein
MIELIETIIHDNDIKVVIAVDDSDNFYKYDYLITSLKFDSRYNMPLLVRSIYENWIYSVTIKTPWMRDPKAIVTCERYLGCTGNILYTFCKLKCLVIFNNWEKCEAFFGLWKTPNDHKRFILQKDVLLGAIITPQHVNYNSRGFCNHIKYPLIKLGSINCLEKISNILKLRLAKTKFMDVENMLKIILSYLI